MRDYELKEDDDGNSMHCHCGRLAIIQDLVVGDLCGDHFEEAAIEEAEERKLEKQLDARENYGEYPKGYDGR